MWIICQHSDKVKVFFFDCFFFCLFVLHNHVLNQNVIIIGYAIISFAFLQNPLLHRIVFCYDAEPLSLLFQIQQSLPVGVRGTKFNLDILQIDKLWNIHFPLPHYCLIVLMKRRYTEWDEDWTLYATLTPTIQFFFLAFPLRWITNTQGVAGEGICLIAFLLPYVCSLKS